LEDPYPCRMTNRITELNAYLLGQKLTQEQAMEF
jgi:hypothetical protein